MKDKLYKFYITIFFKDKTTTSMETYDDNILGDNIALTSDGVYILTKQNKDLVPWGYSGFPLENNIKEILVNFKEIK